MNSLNKVFLTITILALFFNSCKKKEIDNETQSITDNILCEQEFMRIIATINAKAINNQGVKRLSGGLNLNTHSCPHDSTIGDTTWVSTTDLPGILLNYGTGCTDDIDGKLRSGKIEARFSKSFDSIGCVVTITLSNYIVSGLNYSGTVRYTKNSPTSFNLEITNGVCSKLPWSIQWNSTRMVVWKSGFNTPVDETDDVIEITGTASGVNREGKPYEVVIKTPLSKTTNCKWLQSGTFEITPKDLKVRTVDFGSGSCDNEGTYSIEGKTIRFVMQ